jgi:hypothetical protein
LTPLNAPALGWLLRITATPRKRSVVLSSLLSILLAVVLLEVGSGLMGLLLPVHAELAGLSSVMLGLLGGTYYLGFL